MGRTTCTGPQCLYSTSKHLITLWAINPLDYQSACTVQLNFYSLYAPYILYSASVPEKCSYLPTPPKVSTDFTEQQCL